MEQATDGADELLRLADDLTDRIKVHRAALQHVMNNSDGALRSRLRLLLLLANEVEINRNHLNEYAGAPLSEVSSLDRLGIVEIDAGNVRLTVAGENLLTLLLFFQKEMQGAMSEGFTEMVQAAMVGNLDPSVMGRMLVGSAQRYSASLRLAAASGSLLELEKHQETRRRGARHVRHILTFLNDRLDAHTAAGLDSAAIELHDASTEQDEVHVRMHRENLELPHGLTHRDLVESLRQHSPVGLARILNQHRVLRFLPRVALRSTFEADLPTRFHTERSPIEDEEAPIRIQAATPGPPPLRRAWQSLLDSLEGARDGDHLHLVARDSHAYLSGVYHAMRGKLPTRIGLPEIRFEVDHNRRVRHGPVLDGPLVTIRRFP